MQRKGWGQRKKSGTAVIWAEIGLSSCETALMAFQVLWNCLVVSVLRSLTIKWWIRSFFILPACNFWDNKSSSKIVLKVFSNIPLVSSWNRRHILTVCLHTSTWNHDYIWRIQANPQNLPAENTSKFKIDIIFLYQWILLIYVPFSILVWKCLSVACLLLRTILRLEVKM